MDFWYYNEPQVAMINPNTGPKRGGNLLNVTGEGFKPFNPEAGDIDISNSTFCIWPQSMRKTKATVKTSTLITCPAPEELGQDEEIVEISLNVQDTSDNKNEYRWLPTIPIDVSPRRGPTKGGTELTITGSNFTDSGEIACRFVDKIVKAKRINSAEIRCIAPPWP